MCPLPQLYKWLDNSPCQGLTNSKSYTSTGVKLPSLCLEEGIFFIALIVA